MEYSASKTADSTAPIAAALAMQPTPIEDLEKRLAVLKAAGVREYADGQIHILFERPPRQQEGADLAERFARFQMEQERMINGG